MEEEVTEEVRIIPKRFEFRACPVCDTMARFPEGSELFKHFEVVEALINKVKEE
jgi:hypothetical protein